MTEDEARTKWCPQVRCDGNNRHWGSTGAAPISRCIGSDCMAWRWGRRDWVRVEFTDGTMRDGERPEELLIEGPWPAPVRNVTPLTDEGFCGLAGAAQ